MLQIGIEPGGIEAIQEETETELRAALNPR
jgi:hypothetical protein